MRVMDQLASNMHKSMMAGLALVVTTAMATSFNKPTKEYVDFNDNEIRKEVQNVRALHDNEFRNLERTIKIEMDALRRSVDDWKSLDRDKYELILKLIEKDKNSK